MFLSLSDPYNLEPCIYYYHMDIRDTTGNKREILPPVALMADVRFAISHCLYLST